MTDETWNLLIHTFEACFMAYLAYMTRHNSGKIGAVGRMVNGEMTRARKQAEDSSLIEVEAAYRRGIVQGQADLAAATDRAFEHGRQVPMPPKGDDP